MRCAWRFGRAPRPLSRPWHRLARGVFCAAALWLAGAAAALAQAVGLVAAWYAEPTDRYPHAVLGDAFEYGALAVRLQDGTEHRAVLEPALVFEDIAPRLADLDGDGLAEIITVESDASAGARLAIWTVDRRGLRRLIATPHIGTRFRWLAPVGAADLDGDGAVEIAYIDRPHLAKTLRVWRFTRDGGRVTLALVAALGQLSNHRIGWDYIIGGLRDCGAGPEMILASGDWRAVMAVRLEAGALRAIRLGPYSAAAVSAARACKTLSD